MRSGRWWRGLRSRLRLDGVKDRHLNRSGRSGRSDRYDIGRLKQAMMIPVSNDGPLGPEWLGHPLQSEWTDHRERHIGGDFLLIYQAPGGAIVFVRAGTHAELFEQATTTVLIHPPLTITRHLSLAV